MIIALSLQSVALEARKEKTEVEERTDAEEIKSMVVDAALFKENHDERGGSGGGV